MEQISLHPHHIHRYLSEINILISIGKSYIGQTPFCKVTEIFPIETRIETATGWKFNL